MRTTEATDLTEPARLTDPTGPEALTDPGGPDDLHALPCLHERVARWAARTPDAPALRFEGATWTYAELDGRANRLAAHLRRLGVARESVVGVLMERGPHLPLAMLAVLKAGGAYLPMDPEQPADRLGYLLRDAGCDMVVTSTALAARVPDEAAVVCLDDPYTADMLAALPDVDPGLPARQDQLAYVIYTSGSTGRPKGTLVPHRGAVNLTAHMARQFTIGPGDRWLQFTNPCFDVHVLEVFGALTNGATLVQGSALTLLDPRALTALMSSEGVSVVSFTTAILPLLDPADLPALRVLNVGGEQLSRFQADRWSSAERVVNNQYGPTEVTVACTEQRHDPAAGVPKPLIGEAMPNLRALVVSPDGEPVPAGEYGELLMGGAGVVRGYLDRPGLTALKFVPDPFGAHGERLYRTGDLVRWMPDGTGLEFAGRIDTQIKLHGHRIEPGEVEEVLLSHPGIKDAVVDLHRPSEEGSEPVLVAYVTGPEVPGTAAVQAYLGEVLPLYMVPGRVVVLDEIPLTRNGKVDRRALAAA
ncbi:amino acid adenylation domain-containing protein [Streptomyces sp. NPDC048338]|uniref:amino acid adenylation domain-containing protein n=1 Tax=Streptomyces sp. NPDC048338 TaxID=3365536 RepID=UPI003713FF06